MYMLSILDLELSCLQLQLCSPDRLCYWEKSLFFEYVNSVLKEAISRIVLVIDSYEI